VTGWQPSSDAGTARRRAALLARARAFFSEHGVLAVDTPALSHSTVSDPNIDSLTVHSALAAEPLYLQTSPEFAMKRLLAAGYPDIYSICRVFRDAESGHRHEPEFTMIEWYRRGFGLDAMAHETCALVAAVLQRPALAADAITVEYRDAFEAVVGADPLTAPIDRLADAADADARLRQSLGEYRDGWLDLLFSTRVAAALTPDRLTVVRHYPASQAALARLCPQDDGVADRFEVFFGALELANGYVELTDAARQRARFEADNARRRAAGQPVRPIDEALLAALDHGLPDCAGVALGFERLHMIHDDARDIADVMTFSFGRKLNRGTTDA